MVVGRVRVYVVLMFVSSGASAQDAVANWFPTHAGDKWTYEHTTRDDRGEGPRRLEVHVWKTEETITGSWAVPEGTVVGRQVRVIEGSPRDRVDPSPAYLIRGNCVYGDYGIWNPDAHEVTAQFHKALNAGYVSPDFCFPLAVHKEWGAPHGLPDWGVTRPEDAKDWEVAGIKEHDPRAPGDRNMYHIKSISAYPGAGITVDIWFAKGVGLIRKDAVHHGTIGEERIRLIRFQSAGER